VLPAIPSSESARTTAVGSKSSITCSDAPWRTTQKLAIAAAA
jgi:hypothetical protein